MGWVEINSLYLCLLLLTFDHVVSLFLFLFFLFLCPERGCWLLVSLSSSPACCSPELPFLSRSV